MNKRQVKKLSRKRCPRCRREDNILMWLLTSWGGRSFMKCVICQCECGYKK